MANKVKRHPRTAEPPVRGGDSLLDGILQRLASAAKSPRTRAWAQGLIAGGAAGASGDTSGAGGPPARHRGRRRSVAHRAPATARPTKE
jgi:hypothetical protein